MPSLTKTLALMIALFISATFAVHPVIVKGQDFVDSVTNKRIVIIGVDYQPGGQSGYNPQSGQDPLSNATDCLRDAALLQRLGVNTIRVYNVDPTVNHDDCASIFNAVGIYMIIDVNSPLAGESINRADPGSSYTSSYLNRTFGVVENFKGYPNTLGFFAGNEIMNDVSTAQDNPPYIRAVQRDLKNYIAKHADRTIPVGYSAADVRDILSDTWAYLQCAIDGDDKDTSRSDFFGLNSYSWCGQSSFQTAGYDVLVNMFQNSTIPVFFSEYGCNKVEPRVFDEVSALYGSQMVALSGGCIYEYSQEEANFGLVQINDNATVTLLTDYDNLQKQYNRLDINLIQSTNTTATDLTPPKCDSSLITEAGFSTDFDIPDIPQGGQDLIDNGIQNPVQGKLVQVKETAVPMAVYGSNGVQVSNLAIKPLSNDDSNTPSGDTTSPSGTGSGSASAASPTSSKKGAASTLSLNGTIILLCSFLVGLTLL